MLLSMTGARHAGAPLLQHLKHLTCCMHGIKILISFRAPAVGTPVQQPSISACRRRLQPACVPGDYGRRIQTLVANIPKVLTKRIHQDSLARSPAPRMHLPKLPPPQPFSNPRKHGPDDSCSHHPLGTNDPWANLEPSDEHPNGPMLGRTLTLIVPRGRSLMHPVWLRRKLADSFPP